MTDSDIVIPAGLHPKVREALADLLNCVATGFTGKLEIHFAEGAPQLRSRTDTRKYGATPRRPA